MTVPVNATDVTNVYDYVETAIDHILVSWCEDDHDVNLAVLMDALTNLVCAKHELASMRKRIEAESSGEPPSEIREMASALASGSRS